MIYLLLIVPIAATLIFCFAAIMANFAAFKPPKINGQPTLQSTDGQKVVFKSGKNRLTGFIANEEGKRGLIVISHGMGTSVCYHMPEIRHFTDEGYKVFAFEYGGYGESTGKFYGFPQAVTDLKNAIEFIDDGTLPVILFGHSMGGYAACTVPSLLNRPVKAIVAYAPFFSSGEAIKETARKIPKFGKLFGFLVSFAQFLIFGTRRKLNAVDGLLAANTPSLILQGNNDEEVTCDGCSLYARRSSLENTNVRFEQIENDGGNGHMTILRKNGSNRVNDETMKIVDLFLKNLT